MVEACNETLMGALDIRSHRKALSASESKSFLLNRVLRLWLMKYHHLPFIRMLDCSNFGHSFLTIFINAFLNLLTNAIYCYGDDSNLHNAQFLQNKHLYIASSILVTQLTLM